MRNLILATALAGCLQPTAAQALTLQQALIAASTYNAEINAARSQHDADNQKKYQGFSGLLPVIALNGSWTKNDQPEATYSAGVERHNYSLNLTQPIFDVSKYATWRKSLVIADLADVSFLQAQEKLIGNVVSAYFKVIYQRNVLETGEKVKSAFDAQFNQAQQALSVGDGTKLDLTEAQANYDKAAADVLSSENDLNDAEVSFAQLTGLDAKAVPNQSLGCVPLKGEGDFQAMKQAAMSNNLNVLSALYTLKGSEADMIAANGQHLPVVTFQASYGKNWSRAEDGNVLDELFGTTSKTDNSVIGVNVSIPIFNGGSMISQSLEAAHRRSQSQDLLLEARRQAEQDTAIAASGVKSGLARIKAYQQAIRSAKERLSSTRYGREMGQRTLIDEFNAEKDYYQAIQDLAQAQYNYVLSIVKLKSATGTLDYAAMQSFSCGTAQGAQS